MAEPKAPEKDLPAPSDVQQVSAASGVSLAGLRGFGKLLSATYATLAAHVGSSDANGASASRH
jgi:hypothetical protein